MYFNNYIHELMNDVFTEESLRVHKTLPRTIDVGTSSFYYEQYESTPEKHRARFVYEEEDVWDTEDAAIELEARVLFSDNSLLLKVSHYDKNSGHRKIQNGKPIIHRYVAPFSMTEEEHFQLSTVQEVLPFEVHAHITKFMLAIHEEYNVRLNNSDD